MDHRKSNDESVLVAMAIPAQARKADLNLSKTWRARTVKVDDGAGGKKWPRQRWQAKCDPTSTSFLLALTTI
ncbi:hypothetical protein [Janthinobacterium sp. ROICE36]|uniref:hypothetical protein n=1 Tax=Janthinobacterium sp. ROICE36 TaxID=2048670 RepID=UPI0011AF7D7F|nr:hypothetical protein [Janthinobacterium sp. ROICE36]